MAEEQKRGRGRPATQTAEVRKEQLRKAKADQRARDKEAGLVELKAKVSMATKAVLVAYQQRHGLETIGKALEVIIAEINVDPSS